jgi:hypothetical protein
MSFRVLKSLWLLLFISGIILLIEAPIWLVSIIAIVHFVRIVPIIELILVLLTWLRISLMHSIVIKYLIMVCFLSQFNFLQSHNIIWIKTLDLLQILRHMLQRILLIQRNRIMTRTFSNWVLYFFIHLATLSLNRWLEWRTIGIYLRNGSCRVQQMKVLAWCMFILLGLFSSSLIDF